jgi:hypothetical protein
VEVPAGEPSFHGESEPALSASHPTGLPVPMEAPYRTCAPGTHIAYLCVPCGGVNQRGTIFGVVSALPVCRPVISCLLHAFAVETFPTKVFLQLLWHSSVIYTLTNYLREQHLCSKLQPLSPCSGRRGCSRNTYHPVILEGNTSP